MNSPRQRPWHQNSQQHSLLEYASLKQTCPEGIYLSIRPGSPTLWSGVLFVRKGPYAPAILRFQISFPPDYPTLPPSITFISDIFHPLVAPLTTYTYTTGSSNAETVSATDEERLPPGGFSLRHGFPEWFEKARSAAVSTPSSRNVSGVSDGAAKHEGLAHIVPPSEDLFAGYTSWRCQPASTNTGIIRVLQYMKRAFDDESALDSLPLEAAGNSGAWKAWQAYRRSTNSHIGGCVSETNDQQQNEWSWDGVWEQRVQKGIDASTAPSTLYGGVSVGDDIIRFSELGDEMIDEIKGREVACANNE